MVSPTDYERAQARLATSSGGGCVAQATGPPLGLKGRSAIAARRPTAALTPSLRDPAAGPPRGQAQPAHPGRATHPPPTKSLKRSLYGLTGLPRQENASVDRDRAQRAGLDAHRRASTPPSSTGVSTGAQGGGSLVSRMRKYRPRR
jgi:hypothetical protein